MTVPTHPAPPEREQEPDKHTETARGAVPSAPAADTLRAAVLGVDGVTDVFPARPLWQRLPAGALARLHKAAGRQGAASQVEPDDGPLVEEGADGSAPEVTVRIGVGAGARTPDVVRAVAAAVRCHFAPMEVSVKVTVARISPE